jgi:hypothetical protein
MLVLCILKLLGKGSECPECGMELTEKVAQGTATEKRTPITPMKKQNAVSNTKTVAATSFTINEIVSSYLKLKMHL